MANQSDMTGLQRSIKYRPDIDGLRAVAVISVVTYHVGLGWLNGGFVGVDIFFVISGYLIGSLVYKEIREGKFSIANFYQRRAKRILPALFGVLLFSYAAAFLILSPMEMKMFSGSALAAITSSSNIYFFLRTSGYFATNTDLSPLLMTWSLGVEEQFYILFPLLMLVMRKARWRFQFAVIGGLAVISLILAVWSTYRFPGFAFYLLPARSWELAIGVLLAIFEINRKRNSQSLPLSLAHSMSVLGFILIASSTILLNRNTPFPGFAVLLPVFGTVLIIAARHGIINQILSLRPIVFVGLISYSWYLWHWPLLSFARITSDSGIHRYMGLFIGLFSFALAVLSYLFIERPFRRSTTPTRVLLLRYGALATVMTLPGIVFHVTNGLPQRNLAAQRLEVASHDLDHDTCLVQEPVQHIPLRTPCVSSGHGPAVALLGDSHAAELAIPLRSIAQQSDYRFIELTKGWCPALEGVTRNVPGQPRLADDCSQFNRERLKYVLNNKDVKVVVLAAFWSAPFTDDHPGDSYVADGQNPDVVSQAQSYALFEHGLGDLVRTLDRSGKILYLVEDNPQFTFDPTRLLRTRLIEPRRELASLVASSTLQFASDIAPDLNPPASQRVRDFLQTLAVTTPQTSLIDLRSELCARNGCRFAQGNRTLYNDDNHLSKLGAQVALTGFRF